MSLDPLLPLGPRVAPLGDSGATRVPRPPPPPSTPFFPSPLPETAAGKHARALVKVAARISALHPLSEACGSWGGGPNRRGGVVGRWAAFAGVLASVPGRAGGGWLVESGRGAKFLRQIWRFEIPSRLPLSRRRRWLVICSLALALVRVGGQLGDRGKPWPVRPVRRRQRPRALLSSMGAQPRSPVSTPTHPARVKTLYPLGFGGGGALRAVTLLEAPLGRRDAVGRRCR